VIVIVPIPTWNITDALINNARTSIAAITTWQPLGHCGTNQQYAGPVIQQFNDTCEATGNCTNWSICEKFCDTKVPIINIFQSGCSRVKRFMLVHFIVSMMIMR